MVLFLPIGGLYGTYHLLRELETTTELWEGWVLLVDGSEIPIAGVVDGVGSMEWNLVPLIGGIGDV